MSATAAPKFYTDARAGSLLVGHARRRAVTGVFGVPPEHQSFLTTVLLLGAGAAVVGGLVSRPLPRVSGADAALGGTLLNVTLRGVAGAPSGTVPVAGGLILFAVVSHSLRPAVRGTIRAGVELERSARVAASSWYSRALGSSA